MCDYCQWITESPTLSKNQNQDLKMEKLTIKIGEKKPLPIIIIHGFPSHLKNPSILNLMKKIATEGYKKLIQGRESIQVVELTISQLEKCTNYTRGAAIKSAILADDEGRTGCLTGSTDSCTISGAREHLERGLHPLIIREGLMNKAKNKNDEDEKSGCWGVIARDKNEKITCGRINWELNEKYPLSIPPSTIYGCGIFIKNKTCFSLTGDEEIIYSRISARKLSNIVKTSDKHLTSKREITRFMREFDEKSIGIVFLGNFDRPVIFCKSEFFPWISCCRNMINFGSSEREIHSEDVVWDGEINCTCHWR